MAIQIENTEQLSSVLAKINQLPNILEVKRKT
jgi:GTP pyrophosphokinase